jgi:hypothetical protein
MITDHADRAHQPSPGRSVLQLDVIRRRQTKLQAGVVVVPFVFGKDTT